jgi:hypothetical protein
MMKKIAGAAVVAAMTANAALASSLDVKVNVPAPTPPGVSVQVGRPAPPQKVIVERETVIVKEKGDKGKHKGHYKQKKKHKKDKD